MKIIFIHAPNRLYRNGQIVRFKIMQVPEGVFSLAAMLRDMDHDIEVLHLGLEWIADNSFSLRDYLKAAKPDIVGFSFFWALSINDVIDAVAEAREAVPDAKIILGGISASGWDREIMVMSPAVDFIIRGDAERPLADLLNAVSLGSGFDSIPNLTWRAEDGIVHRNPISYLATEEDLSRVPFPDLSLMRHSELYSTDIEHFVDGSSDAWRSTATARSVVLMRGCSANCAYCGGTREAHPRITGRRGVMYWPRETILRNLEILSDHGVRTLCLFWIAPGYREDYFTDLFHEIRRRNLVFRAEFDTIPLPSKSMVEAICETFTDAPPEFHLYSRSISETQAVMHRQNYLSRTALEEWLRITAHHGIRLHLSLYPFPNTSIREVADAARWMRTLMDRYDIRTDVDPAIMDPNSAWHLHPELFDIKRTWETAAEFAALQRTASMDGRTELGYRAEALSEKLALARDILQRR